MSLIILGLDGMNLDLLELCKESMPHLVSLLSKSAYGTAKGVFPLHSGPAWTSIHTGQGIGRHGYINSFYYDTNLNMQLNDHDEISDEHFYELISRQGGKVFLMDVPFSTSRKIPGDFLESCFSTKNQDNLVLPKNLAERFPSITKYVNYKPKGKNLNEFIKGFTEIVDNNGKILKEVITSKQHDLMFFQFGVVDWIQHKALIDIKYNPNSKKVRIAKQIIHEVDSLIGWIVSNISDDDHIIIISDHGNSELQGTFFINTWLKKHGYLSLKDNVDKTVDKKSLLRMLTRFAKSNRIILNIAKSIHRKMISRIGKEIKEFELIDFENSKAICFIKNTPIIKILENDSIKKERIKQEISITLKNDLGFNSKEINAYYNCNDLHIQQRLSRFGDLVVDLDEYELDVFLNNKTFLPGKAMYHDKNAIFLAYGPKVKPCKISSTASILDFFPTILAIYDLPIPFDLQGEVLDILKQPYKDNIKRCNPTVDSSRVCEELIAEINW